MIHYGLITTTNDYIIVEFVLGATRITFKFKVLDNEYITKKFTDFWKNNPEFIIDGNSATIEVELSPLWGETIHLPNLSPCKLISESTDDVIIDDKSRWIYVNKTNKCKITIPLKFECECESEFTINLRNTHPACDSSEVDSFDCALVIWDFILLNVDSCGNTNCRAIATLTDTTKKITKIEIFGVVVPGGQLFLVDELEFSNGINEAIIDKKIGCLRVTYPPRQIDVCNCYMISVTFDDGDSCIVPMGIFNDQCKCFSIFDMVEVYPVPCCSGGSNLEVAFLLAQQLTTPLTISILNQLGILQMIVYEGIPTLLQNNISVDINSLPTGVYYINFQTTDELFSIPFIKN